MQGIRKWAQRQQRLPPASQRADHSQAAAAPAGLLLQQRWPHTAGCWLILP